MTVEETAAALNELAKLIAENTPDMTQEAALNAKAFIQERIQEIGHDANEVQLNPYSDEYKKVRNKKGFETAFTNLTFTGEMWRSTTIIDASQQGNKYVVSVGGNSGLTKDKINWNSERYGDILRTSKKEEIQLQEQIDSRLNDMIKQAGL